MKRIADTGLLVAAADSRDQHHAWAVTSLRNLTPFHTCEAVVLETAWMLGSPRGVLSLLARGDLVLDPDFSLSAELDRLLALCNKYADREMDLADACLVRMTELTGRCKIWTVDRADFTAYRRHGRLPVPCEFPPRD